MKYLLLLLATAFSVGCAGSALDTDFRTKVAEVDPKVTVTVDSSGGGGGTVGARIILRDPTKTGLSK